MNTPAPLETFYKGYRFRSRLEARWAVFFDALGIGWEYEPEAFDLGEGGYLPDFRLDAGPGGFGGFGSKMWAEVKAPDHLFPRARPFAKKVAPILCLEGPPDLTAYFVETGVSATEARACFNIGPAVSGQAEDAPAWPVVLFRREGGAAVMLPRAKSRRLPNPNEALISAVAAARSARFEQNRTAAESLHG
jgi:hypothetical protein